MLALDLSLVALWIVFYAVTERIIRGNMTLQAETASDAIITAVEEKLVLLEESAANIASKDYVAKVMTAEETHVFYDLGAEAAIESRDTVESFKEADNVVFYNSDGLFYRVKGELSNTMLMKGFYDISDKDAGTVTLASNGENFIGTFRAVYRNGLKCGHVLLLLEETRLERMLKLYDDLDYLKVVLTSGDRVLCTNFDKADMQVTELEDRAEFIKEKEIGLSGFKLRVYCEDSISGNMSGYFRLALPLTIAILTGILLLFLNHIKNHMINPIGAVIEGTVQASERGELARPLEHTGEVYLDDLVDHVNEMMKRLEDADKTFVTLLKKQINAHFTVNTLNVIRALVGRGESEQAAHICDELAVLLRYANAGDEKISLLEEFYVIEQYIGIMQTRYPGKIDAYIEPEDSFDRIYIPRMLVQPVVENAIVHGLAGKKGTVKVWAKIGESALSIWVSDDGKGMSEEELGALKESIYDTDVSEPGDLRGIALRNIERRIRMVCGELYGIDIETKQGEGTTVSITLPISV